MKSVPRGPEPQEEWYYLMRSGLLLRVPPEVSPENRVAWCRDRGAMVLRRGNQIVWRRAQDPACRPVRSQSGPDSTPPVIPGQRQRRHLSVVR